VFDEEPVGEWGPNGAKGVENPGENPRGKWQRNPSGAQTESTTQTAAKKSTQNDVVVSDVDAKEMQAVRSCTGKLKGREMDGSNNTEIKAVPVMHSKVFVLMKLFAFKRIRKENCLYL